MLKKRLIYEEIKHYFGAKEAIIITGMRRTGKTTLLQQIYESIESSNKIFIDLENPINRKYFEEDNYEKIRYSMEILGIDFSRKSYIFLDEIQFNKNLPSVVKYFIDHHHVKFYLTGSASFYMKNLFAESLAGRKYIFELYPMSFREFLLFKDSTLKIPENNQQISHVIWETFSPLYDEYVMFGGFPEIVLKGSVEEKKKSLEDIFKSFFQLEVGQIKDFRRNDIIRDLMLLLIRRAGSKLDIQKISRELGVSRPTLYTYLSFLEGTYFIKLVRPLSRNKDTEIRKMPKVYICDTGIANHFGRLDEGILFENSIFQNLRMKGSLHYYQKKSGAEIDFILNNKDAYEIKMSPTDYDFRKLKELCSNLGLEHCQIVARKYCEKDEVAYGFEI